jgi:hypothetical protein
MEVMRTTNYAPVGGIATGGIVSGGRWRNKLWDNNLKFRVVVVKLSFLFINLENSVKIALQ